MRTTWLAIWLLLPAIAFPQTAPPVGDIFQSGAPQPVEQAFQKLYQISAQITADPSFDFQQAHADQTNWPDIAKAQAQWDTAMSQSDTALTQDQRKNIIPCVAYLNAAITDMERGYLIHISQQSNALAQRSAVVLYGEGKLEFAKCLSTGAVADNGTTPGVNGGTAGGTNGATPGANNGGTPPSSAGGISGNTDDFSKQLLTDAQTLLQNAGRISKAMTDGMDVTRHNNVGIGVAVSAYFGAASELLGVVAQQYKVLAATGNAVAATQRAPILEIASEAAADSGGLANQAEQSVSQMGKTGGTPSGAPMGTGAPSAVPRGTNYQQGMVLKGVAGMPSQGELPICGVLSCARIAQLLQRNIPSLRALSVGIGPNGLTAAQIAAALQKAGINAEVGTGMTNMMNEVRAGTPVIAGIKTAAAADSPLHAVVIEGLETQGGVAGLNVYDPAGWYYWQPIKAFEKYFTGDFIKPI